MHELKKPGVYLCRGVGAQLATAHLVQIKMPGHVPPDPWGDGEQWPEFRLDSIDPNHPHLCYGRLEAFKEHPGLLLCGPIPEVV